MVSENNLGTDAAVAESPAPEEVEEDLLPDEAVDSPAEDESLPDIATLAQELDTLRTTAATRADVERALRAAGRVETLQSELDRLSNADPLAQVTPQIAQLQETIDLMVEGLADVLPDEARAQLAQRRSATDVQRLIDQRLQELLPAQEPTETPQAPQSDPIWAQATNDVVLEAQARGLDPATIPQNVWVEGVSQGTPYKAVQHVIAWLDEQSDGGAAERTNSRRRTAAPSPPSAGVAMTDDQLIDDYGLHPEKYTSAEQKQKVYDALGRLQSS